jgi:RimJ/RimL family protein N-acetyltransferase
MFIRTERLFLRPAWREDVAELTRAIGQEPVARMLARVPWPYTEADARAWIEAPRAPQLPSLLVTLPEEGGRIVGGAGLHEDDGRPAVGYWIAPGDWRRGYATEALGGLLSLARIAGHGHVVGRHAADNPASARVLRKAGFRPTGRSRAFHSLGRKAKIDAPEYAIDLSEADGPQDAPMRRAA